MTAEQKWKRNAINKKHRCARMISPIRSFRPPCRVLDLSRFKPSSPSSVRPSARLSGWLLRSRDFISVQGASKRDGIAKAKQSKMRTARTGQRWRSDGDDAVSPSEPASFSPLHFRVLKCLSFSQLRRTQCMDGICIFVRKLHAVATCGSFWRAAGATGLEKKERRR